MIQLNILGIFLFSKKNIELNIKYFRILKLFLSRDDCCESIKTRNVFNYDYIESESNDDRYKKLFDFIF